MPAAQAVKVSIRPDAVRRIKDPNASSSTESTDSSTSPKDSSSSEESEDKDKQTTSSGKKSASTKDKAPQKVNAPPKKQPVPSSSSSSEESESEAEESANPSPAKSSSSVEASTETAESTTGPSQSSSAQSSQTASGVSSEKESESGSGSDSSDEEESSSEAPDESDRDERPQERPTSETLKTTNIAKRSSYRPPADYTVVTQSTIVDLGATTILNANALEGKEIWSISAPADIDLANVRHLTLDKILSGSSVLSHEGDDYSFVVDNKVPKTQSLFVASKAKKGYASVKCKTQQALQLQRQLRIPNHTKSPQRPPQPSTSVPQPHNRQPPGLKMRWQAFGIPSKILPPASEAARATAAVSARAATLSPTPQPPEEHRSPKKRKRDDAKMPSPEVRPSSRFQLPASFLDSLSTLRRPTDGSQASNDSHGSERQKGKKRKSVRFDNSAPGASAGEPAGKPGQGKAKKKKDDSPKKGKRTADDQRAKLLEPFRVPGRPPSDQPEDAANMSSSEQTSTAASSAESNGAGTVSVTNDTSTSAADSNKSDAQLRAEKKQRKLEKRRIKEERRRKKEEKRLRREARAKKAAS